MPLIVFAISSPCFVRWSRGPDRGGIWLIAYDDMGDVWTVDPATTEQAEVTTDGAAVLDARPYWSLDGTTLAFVSTRPDPNNADGTGEVRMIDPADLANKYSPQWSPDGTKIVYTWRLGVGTPTR